MDPYEMPEEAPAQPRGALSAVAAPEPMTADPKEVMGQLSRMVDPSAKWSAYVAGALKPARGGFGESFGNAMSGYAEGQQKEMELKARYMPLAESAVLRRQQAELNAQRLKAQQAAQWSSVLSGTAASMLTVPGPFGVPQVIEALKMPVSTGRVPAQVAEEFVRQLPQDPTELRAYLQRTAIAESDPFRAVKEQKGVVVPEGASLVNPTTGAPLGTPGKGKDPEFVRLQQIRDALPVGDPRRDELNALLAKMKSHAPATSVSVNTGEKGFKNELQLKSDFRSEPIFKDHSDVSSAYAQIKSSLKQNSPIGDVAGATKIMKILDPGSVVRESELGIAMAAAGKVDRLKNYVEMWMKGYRLTPTQRQEFSALADELYRASAKAYNQKRQEYADLAAPYGVKTDAALGPPAKAPDPAVKKPMTFEEAEAKYGKGAP